MSGLGSISVFTSKELQVSIGYLKAVDKDVSAQIRKHIKSLSTPEWKQEVQSNVRKDIHQRILANGANVRVRNDNIILRAGNSVKKMRGGASPADLARAAEFGADRNRTLTYSARSKNGKTYTVHNRHTTRQLPSPSRSGWAVYPAAADFIPRAAALMTQTTVRSLHEAFEKGS